MRAAQAVQLACGLLILAGLGAADARAGAIGHGHGVGPAPLVAIRPAVVAPGAGAGW